MKIMGILIGCLVLIGIGTYLVGQPQTEPFKRLEETTTSCLQSKKKCRTAKLLCKEKKAQLEKTLDRIFYKS